MTYVAPPGALEEDYESTILSLERSVRNAQIKGLTEHDPKPVKGKTKLPKEVFALADVTNSLNQARGNVKMCGLQETVARIRASVPDGVDKPTARAVSDRYQKLYPESNVPSKRRDTKSPRWDWAVYENYDEWWDATKDFLVDKGYAIDDAVTDSHGKIVSEITIPKHVLRRIVNLDETQIPINGDARSDSRRRNVLLHPHLPNPGQRTTSDDGVHVTGVFGANLADEPIPPHFIFQTTAKSAEAKINLDAVIDLPTVRGRFGHASVRTHRSTVGMTIKGSMNGSEWPRFMKAMEALYPDVSPTNRVLLLLDGGPGKESAQVLLEYAEKGFDFWPLYPNGSGYNQNMDQVPACPPLPAGDRLHMLLSRD